MIDSIPVQMYTVDDIQNIFMIGRTKAYQLMTLIVFIGKPGMNLTLIQPKVAELTTMMVQAGQLGFSNLS